MAISLYSGLPGSGKSYSVVEHVILPALKSGRVVWSNIPLNYQLIQQHYPDCGVYHHFSNSETADIPVFFSSIPPGAVFVLDEAWRVLPSGIKASNIDDTLKSFLAEHRHRVDSLGNALEIYIVSQHPSQLASFLRKLIDTSYVTNKLSAVGADNHFRIDIYPGDYGNLKPADRVNEIFGKYSADVWQYYKSHTLAPNNLTSQITDRTKDSRASIFSRPLFRYGVPLSIAAIIYGVNQVSSGNVFRAPIAQQQHEREQVERSGTPAHADTAAQNAQIPPATPPAPAPSIKKPAYSDSWRITAVLEMGQKKQVVITNENGLRSINPALCESHHDDLRCTVDGEIVTTWTGNAPRLGAAYIPRVEQQKQQQQQQQQNTNQVSNSAPANTSTIRQFPARS